MGAWGSGPFQNDDAGDFVGDLAVVQAWGAADAAFDAVLLVGDDYLEAPEASVGVAAAAIVAHQLGKLVAEIDPEHFAALRALGAPTQALTDKAKAALARIKMQSELGDLWDEAGDKDEWHATIEQIESAL